FIANFFSESESGVADVLLVVLVVPAVLLVPLVPVGVVPEVSVALLVVAEVSVPAVFVASSFFLHPIVSTRSSATRRNDVRFITACSFHFLKLRAWSCYGARNDPRFSDGLGLYSFPSRRSLENN